MRVRSPIDLACLLAATVPDELHDGRFSSVEWLKDTRNIALRIGPNLAMFEWCGPQTYLGHIWFASRGRTALLHARAMIEEMVETYGAKTIRGEIPEKGRRTMLFTRWLGFHPVGEVMRPWGRCIVVQLGELTTAADCGMKEPQSLAS